jgi:hypothetical protein
MQVFKLTSKVLLDPTCAYLIFDDLDELTNHVKEVIEMGDWLDEPGQPLYSVESVEMTALEYAQLPDWA